MPKQTIPAVAPKEVISSEISAYNGAKTDKYIWSQSTKNVDM